MEPEVRANLKEAHRHLICVFRLTSMEEAKTSCPLVVLKRGLVVASKVPYFPVTKLCQKLRITIFKLLFFPVGYVLCSPFQSQSSDLLERCLMYG